MDDTKIPNGKEVFGTVAKNYAQFRPGYPPQLFSFLSSLTPQHDLVWDVGTGTGQAAVELSKYYSRVVGTDTSEGQIQHAERRPNITYAVTPPSTSEQQLQSIIPDSSVDIVTVASAIHWFDLDEFYPQVKRVLKKPGGVIAVWAYWKPNVDPQMDAVREWFFQRALPFSHPGVKVGLEECYKTLPFPFTEVEGIKLEMEEQRTFYEYIGLFRTGSALVGRQEMLDEFIPEFEEAWGVPLHVTRAVRFQLYSKIGKV